MGHSCCGGSCGHDDEPARNASHSDAGGGKKDEDACGCGHAHGGHSAVISDEDRKKLEDEIAKSGFEVREDKEGNIIIANKAE
ncbi:MAG: hypothetical protein WC238_01315 [Parcubacteria group bacterium]|jgi:hypothetical protein